jgi:hypothetical protein
LILQDGTALNALIQDSLFTVDISGLAGTVVGVGELLAWITAALRPHPYLGLASCTPFVKNFVSEYKVGERTSMWCEVDYNLEEVTNTPEPPTGRCWRDLFRNPIIVKGFKIRRRPSDLAGIESSLNIMTSLVQTRRIAVFDNRLFIKGFCTMLIPTKREEDLVIWHVLFNDDGSQIAYTDPRLNEIGIKRDMTDNLTFSDLETARHVVGWCSTVENHAGKFVQH